MKRFPGRRAAHAALGAVAPGAAVRWATDVFSGTRTPGPRPDDVLPIGARRFAVRGSDDVAHGFLWGGDGESRGTVLLVHGWAADSSSMHSLVPPLRALGLRVAAFDGPAHGVHPGHRTTMTRYTRAVGAVLDTLGDVRAVVAHSLGGIAAIGAAAARPGAPPECAVLVAPACTLGGVLDRWDGAGLRLTPALVRGIRGELHRRNGVPVAHWDVVALGARLETPVLVVHDPDDPTVPYSDAEAAAAGLKDARLIRAPGTGHTGILVSAGVGGTVRDFVAAHTDGTGSREGIV
ncbi:alpha/beta hydrolase [Streptomyces somaliensis]|uniref:alpha/beta fold hydrolase n=1 Tax=Streptomyces somaliensis TaxID=78355 RepID=UPI0020CC4C9D|nr:alpha/beta hydrolase [Streptomyces somaliensis]MCP9943730.1 alpha/beta hydrolase [Streptomyces somaliensis]MCP9963024.1 alpha/beta hydrolase [Streptomyces somaliensis]MCP9975874.1 alpha/beta hydrolase [Streptomyces somaliensis]